MLMSDEQITEIQNQLQIRTGEEAGDVLVRNQQILTLNESSYQEIYSILARIRDYMRAQQGHTTEKEKDLQDAMRQCVLLHKSIKRKAETSINELVPGAYPPPADPPTESLDIDCGDGKAAAHAICVTSMPFWGIPGWGYAAAGACLAAQVAAAINCA